MKSSLRIKQALILPVFLALSSLLFSQTPFLHWAKMARNSSEDVGAYNMAIDPAGFVYIVGGFHGTVDFNPSAATFNLTASGGFDAYVQKLDTNGNFIWAVAFSGPTDEEARAIALDNAGNLYITGFFTGTVDFNPAVAVANLTGAGFADQFVVKLTSSGSYLWANRIGTGPFEYVLATDLSLDASGNIYTVGYFTGTVDFNPGAGITNLSSAGFYDAYVQKLDAPGNFLWARKWGGSNAEQSISLNIDAANNLVITGVLCSTTCDFDPGAGVFNLGASPGSTQACFVQRLTSAGAFIGAAKFDGPDGIVNGSSTLDAAGNLIIGGIFGGTVDFDPGAAAITYSRPSFPGYDGFLMKLNSSNVVQWAYQFACSDWMDEAGVVTDQFNNIYFCGDFQGSMDFDPGAGTVNRSTGGYNSFVLKLDPNANFIWLATTENNAEAFAYHVVLDPNLNAYVCGDFNGNEDFDPQATTFNMNAPGTPYAQFVYKLRQINPLLAEGTLQFTATGTPAASHLSWQVAETHPYAAFEVTRSTDGTTFKPIGSVQAHSTSLDYQYTDQDVLPGAHYWYRLSMTDVDGSATVSEIAQVTIPAHDIFVVYPNPASSAVTLESSGPLGTVCIHNTLGQTVYSVDAASLWTITLDVSGFTPGIYVVTAGTRTTRFFRE